MAGYPTDYVAGFIFNIGQERKTLIYSTWIKSWIPGIRVARYPAYQYPMRPYLICEIV